MLILDICQDDKDIINMCKVKSVELGTPLGLAAVYESLKVSLEILNLFIDRLGVLSTVPLLLEGHNDIPPALILWMSRIEGDELNFVVEALDIDQIMKTHDNEGYCLIDIIRGTNNIKLIEIVRAKLGESNYEYDIEGPIEPSPIKSSVSSKKVDSGDLELNLRHHLQTEYAKEAHGEVPVDVMQRVERLKSAGNKSFGQNHYDDALKNYTAALNDTAIPLLKETQVIRAVLHSNIAHCIATMVTSSVSGPQENCLSTAKNHARNAVALRPNWYKGYLRLANIYQLENDWDEASQQIYLSFLCAEEAKDPIVSTLSSLLKQYVNKARSERGLSVNLN